jgi:hypothetical protein
MNALHRRLFIAVNLYSVSFKLEQVLQCFARKDRPRLQELFPAQASSSLDHAVWRRSESEVVRFDSSALCQHMFKRE